MTASKFGEICKISDHRDTEALCHELLHPRQLTTEPILYGTTWAKEAIKQFEKKCDVQVSPCGFLIKTEFSFLGASPDGLVGEDCVLEVKCPFAGRNEFLTAHKICFPFP